MIRLCIFGSRDFSDYTLLRSEAEKIQFDLLICGEARGADLLGKAYAISHGIPIESYPAEWDKYGKRAGFIRNSRMAGVADIGLAFWDGESRGTKMMVNLLREAGKPVVLINYIKDSRLKQLDLFGGVNIE